MLRRSSTFPSWKLRAALACCAFLLFASPLRAGTGTARQSGAERAAARKAMRFEERSVNGRLRANEFCVTRGVNELSQELLGPSFAKAARQWTSSTKVIDLGAGEANLYFSLLNERGGDRSKMPLIVGVGVKRPVRPKCGTLDFINKIKSLHRELRRLDTRLVYLEAKLATGRAKHDRKALAKLGAGMYNAAVDGQGLGQYVKDYHRAIETYGHVLKPGGTVYTHLDPGTSTLKTADGKTVPWELYFKGITGFEVVRMQKVALAGRHGPIERYQVELRRTSGKVQAPELELSSFRSYLPPYRDYIWKGPLPTASTGPAPLQIR
jgi:hypothetical protein